MRILHVLPSISPETGGPAHSVPTLCKSQALDGHRVSLYATPWPQRALPSLDSAEIYETRLFPASGGRVPSSSSLIRALSLDWPSFDVIHVHSIWNPIATFAMRTLRAQGVPYCLTPRGMLDPVVLRRNWPLKSVWGGLWERANVESAGLVHFTTEHERDRARSCGWALPEDVVVGNLLDFAEWDNLPPPADFDRSFPDLAGRPVLLFVGRLNWVKNLPQALEAFARVLQKMPEAAFVLCGPDKDGHESSLRRAASGLGIARSVLFAGRLDRRGLRAAYSRANAAVLLSKKENFGLGAAEALACGVPCVLSPNVGIALELSACPAVKVVDPENFMEVAEAIHSFLALDRPAGEILRREARGAARERWSQRASKRLTEAYSRCLPPAKSVPVTAVVPTKNESANIERCLRNLKRAKRVIVVDSASTDGTTDLAQHMGACVEQFDYAGGYPKKRQWALDCLVEPGEWVFFVDADEVIPPRLWEEVSDALCSPEHSGFYVTKGFHFMGRKFRFGGFSHSAVVLVRQGKAAFEETTATGKGQDMEVHERLCVNGSIGRLLTPLLHHDYKGLRAYLDRHRRYAHWEARVRYDFLNTGNWGRTAVSASLFAGSQERRRFLKQVVIRAPFEPAIWFCYHYFARLGYLEGVAGLVASLIRAAYIREVRSLMGRKTSLQADARHARERR